MEDQPEACLKRASVHFSYLGALGTMRPTFSFPFEGPRPGGQVGRFVLKPPP